MCDDSRPAPLTVIRRLVLRPPSGAGAGAAAPPPSPGQPPGMPWPAGAHPALRRGAAPHYAPHHTFPHVVFLLRPFVFPPHPRPARFTESIRRICPADGALSPFSGSSVAAHRLGVETPAGLAPPPLSPPLPRVPAAQHLSQSLTRSPLFLAVVACRS